MMETRVNAICLDAKDNVVTLTKDIRQGEEVYYRNQAGVLVMIKASQDTPAFHKIATQAIRQNEIVYKYGMPIGMAKKEIAIGGYVHTHNVKSEVSHEI